MDLLRRSFWPSCKCHTLANTSVRDIWLRQNIDEMMQMDVEPCHQPTNHPSIHHCAFSIHGTSHRTWTKNKSGLHTDSNGDDPIWDLARDSPEAVEEVVAEHVHGWVLVEGGYGWVGHWLAGRGWGWLVGLVGYEL